MIEAEQEQANRRLLDGLLAQTLLASLPRQDTAGPENLQHLAQEIESCASVQLRPRLRLVEEKIIPAQLVGGPVKMGLIDFACPSRRAPEAKWRSLLTLNNRAHRAEIDFYEDYDRPVAGMIPLSVGTWAGVTSANSDRFARSRRPESSLGRNRYLSISATASHFAVALDRTLEIRPFSAIQPDPEWQLFAEQTVRRWKFHEAISWIEFDRVVEGLVVAILCDGEIFAIDTKQIDDRAMSVARLSWNHNNNRFVGVAKRSLWLCDGGRLSRIPIEHQRIPYRFPLPSKGDSEHLMSMSADGVWAGWVEPWGDTNWRLKLDSEALAPEETESHPQRDHRDSYATKAVFITSQGAVLTLHRSGVLLKEGRGIQLVAGHWSELPPEFRALIAGDERKIFWEDNGSLRSASLEEPDPITYRQESQQHQLSHQYRYDHDARGLRRSQLHRVKASVEVFRTESITGRIRDGLATFWLPSGTPTPTHAHFRDIVSVQSAGHYLFVLSDSGDGTELSIIDTRNHTLVSWPRLGLEALLSAHESGQVIAVNAHTRKLRVIGGKEVLQFTIRVPAGALGAWSRDGRFFAVEASDPSGIAIVEAATRIPMHLWSRVELPSGHKVSALALSRDGEVFIGTDLGWIGRYSSKTRSFHWLDTHSRREVKILLLLEGEQRLLAGNSATLRLYDLEDGSLMAFLGNLSRDSLVDPVRDSFGTTQIRVTTLEDATIREQLWSIEEESQRG